MVVRATIAGIGSPEALEKALRGAYYLADDGIATAAYLALALGKPLLLEGAPGVGKTEAAKAIAAVLGRRLIRLELKGDRVIAEEPLLATRCKRVRDVREGPDGALYVLTEEVNGELLRLTPKTK